MGMLQPHSILDQLWEDNMDFIESLSSFQECKTILVVVDCLI